MAMVKRFLNDTRGAAAMEYGLMLALIAVALIAALSLLADNTNQTLDTASDALAAANAAAAE